MIEFKQIGVIRMSKDARAIVNGVHDLVAPYIDIITFDIFDVESAARRSTAKKYLTMAKKWVKVPKKKPMEEWKIGLRDFGAFFEKKLIDQPGLSTLARNRYDSDIVWTCNNIINYTICMQCMNSDWNSYDQIDMIISWENIPNSIIISAIREASERCNNNVPYVNAIIQNRFAQEQVKFRQEQKMVFGLDKIPAISKGECDEIENSCIDLKASEIVDEMRLNSINWEV